MPCGRLWYLFQAYTGLADDGIKHTLLNSLLQVSLSIVVFHIIVGHFDRDWFCQAIYDLAQNIPS